jgi:hypothetical protein
MKLTKIQFLDALRKNCGIYARTSEYIQKVYRVKYTRQAVCSRAKKYPDEVKDIEESVIDLAEGALIDLLKTKDLKAKGRAVEFFLKTKGKKRGYIAESIMNIDFEQANDEQLQTIVENLLKKLNNGTSKNN